MINNDLPEGASPTADAHVLPPASSAPIGASAVDTPPVVLDAPLSVMILTGAPLGSASTSAPALELWRREYEQHLASRGASTTDAGEAIPSTTAGDVRRAALRFSRALCLPRYDGARLCATRAAWRDATARVDVICQQVPWSALYPENERFWLSDTLALAQRLAEVDQRRNQQAIGGDVRAFIGDRSDPVTTWQDLRRYYLARRLVRTDPTAGRYPETTVGDVRAIADVIDADLARVTLELPVLNAARRSLDGHVRRWRATTAQVAAAAVRLPASAVYPDNLDFWRSARRIAIWLSVGADLAREVRPWES